MLSWAANNTAKLGRPPPRNPSAPDTDARECWTLFSTAAYGRANKVPQEAVPPEASKRVTAEMLGAFEKALGAFSFPFRVVLSFPPFACPPLRCC